MFLLALWGVFPISFVDRLRPRTFYDPIRSLNTEAGYGRALSIIPCLFWMFFVLDICFFPSFRYWFAVLLGRSVGRGFGSVFHSMIPPSALLVSLLGRSINLLLLLRPELRGVYTRYTTQHMWAGSGYQAADGRGGTYGIAFAFACFFEGPLMTLLLPLFYLGIRCLELGIIPTISL